MNYRIVVPTFLVVSGILACDQTTPTPTSAVDLASDRAHLPGNAVLQGTVVGDVSDSLPNTQTIPVGGARVDAYLLTFPPGPGDTASSYVLVGTATTGASGGFRLTSLPAGQYTLVATPSAGSAFMTGQAGAAAGPGSASHSIRIVLQLVPPPPTGDSLPPDSLPPPPNSLR